MTLGWGQGWRAKTFFEKEKLGSETFFTEEFEKSMFCYKKKDNCEGPRGWDTISCSSPHLYEGGLDVKEKWHLGVNTLQQNKYEHKFVHFRREVKSYGNFWFLGMNSERQN